MKHLEEISLRIRALADVIAQRDAEIERLGDLLALASRALEGQPLSHQEKELLAQIKAFKKI